MYDLVENDSNMCDVFAKLMLLSFYAFNMNKFMIYYAFGVKASPRDV